MLAATLSLLLLPAADSQKPEELSVHVHVTCVGKYDLHKTDGKSRVDETDEITIEYEATSHNTAPPGTPLWQMSTETSDYHFTVSGNGTGSADDISLSWTWKLVNATTDLRGLMKDLGPGSFEVALPDFQNDAKVEPQVQLQSAGQSKNWLEADAKKAVAQMAIHPLADGAATMFDTPLSKQDYDAMGQFYDQLKGTFDQNAKSFSKSGSASRTSSNALGMTSSIKVEYSFSFNQQPEDVEAILIPQDGYEKWMPEAGPDEDTRGNWMVVNVELQKKDKAGQKPRAKAKSFKFELIGVSKEPGVCLNWPPKAETKKDPDFDLKIDKEGNPSLQVAKDGQSATSGSDVQESSVIVSSYDWGGWGSLKVTAELDNGQTVGAHLKNKPGVTELKIPKDDNNNHIADAFESNGGNRSAPGGSSLPVASNGQSATGSPELQESSMIAFGYGWGAWGSSSTGAAQDQTVLDPYVDDDPLPKGDHNGDTLSYYEEYRGFQIKNEGGHVSTDPNRKDVFIHDRNHLGLGYFAQSGMDIHVLEDGEWKPEGKDWQKENGNVVNFNHGFGYLADAHVLILVDGPAPDRPGAEGETVPPLGSTAIGPPKNVIRVYVDRARCLGSRWGQLEVMNNVAHELAHSCTVLHHGDADYEAAEIWKRDPNGKWNPVTALFNNSRVISVPKGEHSGAMQCVMRYMHGSYYVHDGGQYRWRDPQTGAWVQGEEYGPAEKPGAVFCTGPDGDPPNSKLGRAADDRGNCSAQFCVNDLEHK